MDKYIWFVDKVGGGAPLSQIYSILIFTTINSAKPPNDMALGSIVVTNMLVIVSNSINRTFFFDNFFLLSQNWCVHLKKNQSLQ